MRNIFKLPETDPVLKKAQGLRSTQQLLDEYMERELSGEQFTKLDKYRIIKLRKKRSEYINQIETLASIRPFLITRIYRFFKELRSSI